MTRYLIPVLLLFVMQKAPAQEPVFEWAAGFGASGIDNGRSIGVDAQGSVYSVGLFFNTVDFDPGPGVFNMTAQGPFDMAIYVSKLNNDGQFVWAKQLPCQIEFSPIEMALDPSGYIYVTSELRQLTDMDPGPGVHNIAPASFRDAFVLKLTTGGDFVWVKQFSGLQADTGPFGSAIGVDPAGDVVVTGGFNNRVDFDPGPGVFAMSAVGTYEAFITKLSADGDLIWAKKLGDYTDSYGYVYTHDLKCDQFGNVYTTGHYSGPCDFDPSSATVRMSSGGPGDGFISKLDPAGNYLWAKKIGNSALNYMVFPWGMEIDGQDNVYTAGSFLGTQDFDPGPGVHEVTSNGASDGYILKLSSQGNFIWARNVGGPTEDALGDVAVDNVNNVYVTGFFSGSFDFDPGPGVAPVNFYDGGVVGKFDAGGNFIYAAPFYSGVSGGRRLVTDAQRAIYITGYFGGEVDFDPGTGVYNIYPYGSSYDAFVVKLSKCPNVTTSTLDITTCDHYMLNNYSYDSTGVYTQTIRNAAGCDSIITLRLTINRKFSEQTKAICEGESFVVAGAQQMIAGNYIDTLQSVTGCDSIVTTHLVVNPKPAPSLGNNRALCANTTLTITPGIFTTYLWSNNSTAPSIAVGAPGQYAVLVTNSFGCSASDTISITGIVQPPGDFLPSTDTMCRNVDYVLQSQQEFSQYLWSNGSTSKSTTIHAPGDYRLDVTDANGCAGSDTITVAGKDCSTGIFVPTAFSPNGDGKNDFFMVAARAEVEAFRMQVFDRWGHLVFETKDPKRGWDGGSNSMKPGTSVFVWQCLYKLKNEVPQFQKGTVTLVR